MKQILIILALTLSFSTQAQTRCEVLKKDITFLNKEVNKYEIEKPLNEGKAAEYIKLVMSKVDEDNTAYDILDAMLTNDEISLRQWCLVKMLFKVKEYKYRECQ